MKAGKFQTGDFVSILIGSEMALLNRESTREDEYSYCYSFSPRYAVVIDNAPANLPDFLSSDHHRKSSYIKVIVQFTESSWLMGFVDKNNLRLVAST